MTPHIISRRSFLERVPAGRYLLTALFLLGTLARLRAAADWQVVKVAGRDYLTLQNIARFYQLKPHPDGADRNTIYGDNHASLQAGGDPRVVEINGVKQHLSFPILQQDNQTLVSRFDLAKTIEPCLRPTMIANLPSFHTVVLDAGHGGADGGASGAMGPEKEYTLAVIQAVQKSLAARGFKVLMTRDEDVFIPLEERAAHANQIPDSIFVSVHFNASLTGDDASGFEVFAMSPQGAASTGDEALSLDQFQRQPGNDEDNASLALATCVHSSLLGHIQEIDRGVKRARFVVLKLTHSPAILVEGGFLTNTADSTQIADAAWRERLAQSIADGVQSYQGLANKHHPPKLLAEYRSEQLPLKGTIVKPSTLAASNEPRPPLLLLPVSNAGVFSLLPPMPTFKGPLLNGPAQKPPAEQKPEVR